MREERSSDSSTVGSAIHAAKSALAAAASAGVRAPLEVEPCAAAAPEAARVGLAPPACDPMYSALTDSYWACRASAVSRRRIFALSGAGRWPVAQVAHVVSGQELSTVHTEQGQRLGGPAALASAMRADTSSLRERMEEGSSSREEEEEEEDAPPERPPAAAAAALASSSSSSRAHASHMSPGMMRCPRALFMMPCEPTVGGPSGTTEPSRARTRKKGTPGGVNRARTVAYTCLQVVPSVTRMTTSEGLSSAARGRGMSRTRMRPVLSPAAAMAAKPFTSTPSRSASAAARSLACISRARHVAKAALESSWDTAPRGRPSASSASLLSPSPTSAGRSPAGRRAPAPAAAAAAAAAAPCVRALPAGAPAADAALAAAPAAAGGAGASQLSPLLGSAARAALARLGGPLPAAVAASVSSWAGRMSRLSFASQSPVHTVAAGTAGCMPVT
mmetsp:Transcript_4555/g.19392  ORF Transcript_4555/g.19392 Transcript_4555/m.19392 type:complete len:447 (-) Transcript_4555:1019-2359(-)